jgi:hypothetical protein
MLNKMCIWNAVIPISTIPSPFSRGGSDEAIRGCSSAELSRFNSGKIRVVMQCELNYSHRCFCHISSHIGPISTIPSPFSRGGSDEAIRGVGTAAAARSYRVLILVRFEL